MKRKLFLLVAVAVVSMLAFATMTACSSDDDAAAQQADADFPNEPFVRPTGVRGEGVEIVIYGWNDELSTAMQRYAEMHPDFRFTFRPVTHFTDWDGSYEIGLNAALSAGGADAPDVFFVESNFVVNYTQYDFAHHALTYSELLGVNVRPLIQAAEISPFIVDAGTNRQGNVVGLGFQHTGAGFIYRRDLAEQVWGDGSLNAMANRIGSNTGSWDRFLAAAADAADEGIAMLSDMEDAWQAIRNSPDPWIQNDRLVICDQRMSFLDIGYALYQGNFTNEGGVWNDSWFADMAGVGHRPVMGFLGPAWLINYIMADNAGDTVTRDAQDNITDGVWGLVPAPEAFAWGGTWTIVNRAASEEVRAGLAELIYWLKLDTSDTGFLYLFGSGTLYDGSAIEYTLEKDMVSSQVVQRRLDSTLPFLGGQDMAPVFVEAGAAFTTRGWGPFDRAINGHFADWSAAYFRGELTREEMLDAFRQNVLDDLGFES